MLSRPVSNFLSADQHLAALGKHAQTLAHLQTLWSASLPAPLAAFSQVANLRQGILVIHARSSAVASKLRQMQGRLADSFRANGVEISEIKIKVQPPQGLGQKPVAIKRHIPAGGRRAIQTLATSLPEDDPMGQALRSLLKVSD